MTYAELKSKSFPVAAFEGDEICRRSVWTVAGERLPVSLVQANFIDGGLVLSWCILHLAGDGTSFFTWSQIWAEECRRAQGLEIAEPVELAEEMFADRTRFMGPSGHTAGRLEDHPEYIVLPCESPGKGSSVSQASTTTDASCMKSLQNRHRLRCSVTRIADRCFTSPHLPLRLSKQKLPQAMPRTPPAHGSRRTMLSPRSSGAP